MEELVAFLKGQCKVNRSNFFNEGEMLSKFLPERHITVKGNSYTYKPYSSFPLMPLPPISSNFEPSILKSFAL